MTTKTSRIEGVKKAVVAFEAAQAKYRKFGAQDTEPDSVFQRVIYRTVFGPKLEKLPTSANDWDLYTNTMKCGTAALALTRAARKVHRLISNVPTSARDELEAWARDYCWRYC